LRTSSRIIRRSIYGSTAEAVISISTPVEVDILITAEDPEEDEEELGELLSSLDYRPFATPALAAYVLPVRDWLRTRVRPP